MIPFSTTPIHRVMVPPASSHAQGTVRLEAMEQEAIAIHQAQAAATGDARRKGHRGIGRPAEHQERLQQTHRSQHQEQDLGATPTALGKKNDPTIEMVRLKNDHKFLSNNFHQ